MPRRVEEHAEGRTGLVLVLGRAEREHLRLGGVEVVDVHVDMHLLGYVLSRPLGRGIGLHLLEADAVAVVGADLGPAGFHLGLPVQHRAVEGSENARVRTVEDDAREACDSHARHRTPEPGRSTSAVTLASRPLRITTSSWCQAPPASPISDINATSLSLPRTAG